MDYLSLGRSGLKVSRLCLGMMTYGDPTWRPWVLDEADSRPFIRRALDLGINFFDTADMYSAGMSEQVTGRILHDFVPRQEVIIATKLYNPMSADPNDRGLSRKHIFEAIEASLRRLNTDYIDLYIIHRWDYGTPIEETIEALHEVVKSGKARYIGASSMFAWQFAQAIYTARLRGWTRFISMQNHYNLIYREEEREMNPLCQAEGIGLTPWSPLARGFLAGNRYRDGTGATSRAKNDQRARERYYQPNDFDIVERVIELADKYQVKPTQIALAWLLHQPGVVSPVIGATQLHYIEEAVAALKIKLSAEEIAYLKEPYQPRRVIGPRLPGEIKKGPT